MSCDVSIATLSLDLSKLPSKFKELHYSLPPTCKAFPEKDSLRGTIGCSLRETRLLMEQIEEHADDYDVINPHNFPAHWAAGLIDHGRPVIWHCNEVLGPYGETEELNNCSTVFRFALDWAKKFDRFLVRRTVHSIVTCSNLNRPLIEGAYGRTPLVLNTCVDYPFFSEQIPDAKYKTGFDDIPLLLHVGSFIPRRNQMVSLQAFRMLKRELADAELAFVGVGPWMEAVKNAVERFGLTRDVRFMGEVSEEELRCLYQACDVNLHPVRDQSWGLVPFEALAAGKPSIVSSLSGASEIFSRERLGVVAEPEAKAFAEGAISVLKNPSLVEEMVDRGREFVRRNLSYEEYAENVLKIFESHVTRPNT